VSRVIQGLTTITAKQAAFDFGTVISIYVIHVSVSSIISHKNFKIEVLEINLSS